MKSEKIYKAIGNADDKLMERYESSKKGSPRWLKLGGGLAACLCLALIGSFVLNGTLPVRTPAGRSSGTVPASASGLYKASGTVVESFSSSGSTSMYATPDNGKRLIFTEVQGAMKEHAGQDVEYFLAVDIFTDKTPLEAKSDAAKAELKRLTRLGYHIGYAESWTYEGNGKQVIIPYIAGYFTEKELENFVANQTYGYAFRFAQNGDGSPISAEQGIIIDFDSSSK